MEYSINPYAMEYSRQIPITPAPQTPYYREDGPSSGGGGSSGGGRGRGGARRGRGASQAYSDRNKVTVKVSKETQAWVKQRVTDGHAKDQAEVVDAAIDLYKASLEGLAAVGNEDEQEEQDEQSDDSDARPSHVPTQNT